MDYQLPANEELNLPKYSKKSIYHVSFSALEETLYLYSSQSLNRATITIPLSLRESMMLLAHLLVASFAAVAIAAPSPVKATTPLNPRCPCYIDICHQRIYPPGGSCLLLDAVSMALMADFASGFLRRRPIPVYCQGEELEWFCLRPLARVQSLLTSSQEIDRWVGQSAIVTGERAR